MLEVLETSMNVSSAGRRRFLALCTGVGVTSPLFPGVLYALAQDRRRVDGETIKAAEDLAGIELTEEQREQLRQRLGRQLSGFRRMQEISIPNSVPPAVHFDPRPQNFELRTSKEPPKIELGKPVTAPPSDLEEACFASVADLSRWIQSGDISSYDLTEMYLDRLKRHDNKLHCVITLTEELALEQADRADEEISAGKIRGPLHGIPWGAKDLLNTKGIRTTYGAKPFEDQVLDDDATVVEKLRDAGAVLLGKLTLGALAMGDVWFGGKTRNPWNPDQGSSGSSAGPCAATAGGLVGFAIGTETLGSIVSPCTRCGTTGLRPTFGRVSRGGAMALSWSMDKIGPIARSVEDCALIFAGIHGVDPRDPTTIDAAFDWPPPKPVEKLRVGYLKSAFESRRTSEEDKATLAVLEKVFTKVTPVELPQEFPVNAMISILNAEAATAFDEITRNGQVDELVSQNPGSWPNSFRASRFIPAVEYLRANRLRTQLIEATHEKMKDIDVFVSPSFGGSTLSLTNLTGHPCVVMPNGFRDGSPMSITFIGQLFGETELLQVARTYQDATDFHTQHPVL